MHEAPIAKRLAEWLVQLRQASGCVSRAEAWRLTASGGHGSHAPNGRHTVVDSASTTAICKSTSLQSVRIVDGGWAWTLAMVSSSTSVGISQPRH